MEDTFVEELAKTGDPTYAAWKAGSKNPVVIGQRMAAKPALQEARWDRANRLLREEGALLGVETLMEGARCKTAPWNARINAADKLVKYSGLGSAETTMKDLSEMNGEELAREIARATARQAALQHVAAERARPVIEGELAGEDEADEEADMGVLG